MVAKIRLDGTFEGVSNMTEFLIALTNQTIKIKAEQVAALTDNSTGDDTPTADAVVAVGGAFANVAASGSSLADKTTTEAALVKIKNAITELATKANTFATALSVTGLTDSSGGTTADGTIAACDQSVTGAATGVLAVNINADALLIDGAFAEITLVANRCAVAAGVAPLNITYTGFPTNDGTIAAVSTGGGTAASPGVTKVAMDAALVSWVNNVAYIAAKFNELRATEPVQVTVI